MTEGPIGRQLVLFMAPVLATQLLQQLYLMADAVVLGRFIGAAALAAQGTTALLISVISNFFIGISAGISVLIGQLYGKEDDAGLKSAINTSVTISVLAGAVFTALGIAGAELMLSLLKTPDSVIGLASEYLRICLIGMAPVLLYDVASSTLRALGNSRTPLVILFVSAVLNIVLDVVFICGMSMGIKGAAAATVISQAFAAGLTMFKLMRIDPAYCFDRIKIDSSYLRECLNKGLPAGFQAVFMSISSLVLQTYINSFGQDAMAGMNVFAKIEGFLYFPLFAFGIAVTTFISQNAGAGKIKRVRQGALYSLRMAVFGCIIVVPVLLFVSRSIVWIFTDDAGVVSNALEAIRWIFPCYWLYAINQVYIGVIRGVGNTRFPMITSLCSYCIFRIAWCAALLLHYNTMRVIYTSYDASWVVMIVLLLFGMYKYVDKNMRLTRD